MKVLTEENESLRRSIQNLRTEVKKKDKILLELQEKLGFFETAYNDITRKFEDSYFKQLEKLLNLQPTPENESFLKELEQKGKSDGKDIGKGLEKTPKKNKEIIEIIAKRPKENTHVLGIFLGN